MKSKLLFGFMLISVIASGCDNSSKIKYTLKDTWGPDGNWGNKQSSKVAKNNHVKEKNVKVVEKHEMSHEKNKSNHSETHSEKVDNKTEHSNKMVEHKVSKPVYKWEKVETSGILKANYMKSIPDDNLNFSYAVINNTKVDTQFKKQYKDKLIKAMDGISVVYDKEENVNNKKSWVLAFTYDKDGTKVKQKQVFIPMSKNIMIANFIASEKGFSLVEDEFKSITKNLKL